MAYKKINNKKLIQIAIDGPAGSGKSTIAKLTSKKINFLYIPSGNIYRSIALYFKKNNLFQDFKNWIKIIKRLKIEIKDDLIYLNNENVTQEIKNTDISRLTSEIAKNNKIRKCVTKIIKNIAKENNIVVDGRDIGTIVFPKALVKIYLDANVETRARRRYEELKKSSIDNTQITYEEILNKINNRDREDKERKISPLKKADDAYYIDGSNLTIKDIEEKIIEHYRYKLEKKC